jgi:hypothetical protein
MITKYKQFINEGSSPQKWKLKKSLEKLGIGRGHNYTISDDGKVNVEGDVFIRDDFYNLYGIKFGRIDGDFKLSSKCVNGLDGCPVHVEGEFDCSDQNLTSLEGCPDYVGGSFNCGQNRLTDLIGGPTTVIGSYDCMSNNLSSLLGAPEKVGKFDCSENWLESLEHGPKLVTDGSYWCDSNQLVNLDGIAQGIDYSLHCDWNNLTTLRGCPEKLKGEFRIDNNKLTSLEGCPQYIGDDLLANNNLLTSLKGGPKVFGGLNYFFKDNPITSLEGGPESYSDKSLPIFINCPVSDVYHLFESFEALSLLNEWEVIDGDDMTVSYTRLCEVYEALGEHVPERDEFKFDKYKLID